MTEANGGTAADGARTCVKAARGIFDRAAKLIDKELDRLSRAIAGEDEKSPRHKSLAEHLRHLEKATMAVVESQNRLARFGPEESDGALDLEGARAEILSRLARLAERGRAGEVS